jgi:S-adenosylmethionine:tRNA ribosyltransferase-isomerase
MQLSDFTYELPDELIAHYPAKQRSQSRLLDLNASSGEIQHRVFSDFVDLLRPDDLLVFNDTRVIPARLFGRKESGGRVEVLIERILDDNRVLAQLRVSKSLRPGGRIVFEENDAVQDNASPVAIVEGREGVFTVLQFPVDVNLQELLARLGHIPLPPYIKRSDTAIDAQRYQTVYASKDGAVAAPTAGLHFDQQMLQAIADRGIASAYLTLHVGAGTFQPVRVDNISDHRMHREMIHVSESVCEQVSACKARGGRVIAVGTTTVRSLESAASDHVLKPFHGETDIFIYPGYEFQIVDAMITNFHLSASTLLMLVSAFCGKEMLLGAYTEAIKQGYRFFSYGDAMFINKDVASK